MSNLTLNSRVRHIIFGYGTIASVDGQFITVQFDNGSTKIFHADAFKEMGLFEEINEIGENVKITGIKVTGLFDRLDYDIDVNNRNCVAILSAPNGCGKTTVFKLLNFTFNPQDSTLGEILGIPFSRFECHLSNGKTVALSRTALETTSKTGKSNQMALNLALRFFNDPVDYLLSIEENGKSLKQVSFSESFTSDRRELEQGSFVYYSDPREEIDDIDYPTVLGLRRARKAFNNFNSLLAEMHCKTHIDFIEANRLQKNYISRSARNAMMHGVDNDRIRGREVEHVDFLELANEEMTDLIKRCLGEYNRRLAEAKNKLTAMFLNADESNEVPFENFRNRWMSYHAELDKYHKIGLLESTETVIKADELEYAYEKKATFLTTYLDAFEGTIEPLQTYYEQMKLFADIFNKRNEITGKSVLFTPNGIKIMSGNKEISISCLSSGEKNDFVMFYRLIFNITKNSIVLIDEPEISLHIEWQEEYLDRLIDICEMNGLQAIVATHSPNIVNGHFDLFVEKR